MNYYNENDPKAAAWLRELIVKNLIPFGEVDERSILEVKPHELDDFTQCHFFAGIGGWSYALNLAGWPARKQVWTGSCPCQPFSCAGKGLGESDERHLWPAFRELIKAKKPPVVFGEQVASKAGREWLAGVFADLEGMAYQRAGADLCAAGVGAPNIRQRLFWVADANQGQRRWIAGGERCVNDGAQTGWKQSDRIAESGCEDVGLDNPESNGQQGGVQLHGEHNREIASSGREPGFWSDFRIIDCLDGKQRRIPVEPEFFPLAHGVSSRVVRLRGYGNAINPEVAAQFIAAYMEC